MYKIFIFSFIFMIAACSENTASVEQTSASQEINQPETEFPISVSQIVTPKQGLVAYVDPVTGKLTSEPTVEQSKQMNDAKNARAQYQEPLVEERMANGAYKIKVPQRLHSNLTATIDEKGGLKIQHQSAAVTNDKKLPQ